MKAAVLCANDDLRYQDIPTPECAPGEALVRVRASGICGSDVPRVLNNGAHFYPVVLGHEFAGDVVEVGDGVTELTPGDTVTGAPLLPCMDCADCSAGNYSLCKNYSFIGSRRQGSFAEYVALPARNAVKYSSSVPYEQAAFFEPSTVALHGLLQNGYQGGGAVAVLGGGTIGLFTMQWAKIFGSKIVTVFDIDDERLELAGRLGSTHTVNTLEDGYIARAMALTDGRGYDYVIETAGSPATIHMAFELAANKARVCMIGTPHKDFSFPYKLWEMMNRKEFFLTGSWMSYSAPFPGKEWTLTAHCFATGQLKFDPALIFRRFPLSEAKQAFDLYKSPGQVKGKIILTGE